MAVQDATSRLPIDAHPPGLARRHFADRSFVFWGLAATALGLGVLAALVFELVNDGGRHLTLDFLFSFPSSSPERAGIYSAWVGSFFVILTTAAISIPLGVASGLYLEEYAPKNAITSTIEIAVNNLAGVPSIIFGLLALGLFVQRLDLGQTVLTAGLTLALLILPIVIVATREAVRSVPEDIRNAALALGATKWRTTQDHVLPYALPGVVTGVIIGLSRALGETAPLIVIGGLSFVPYLPILTPSDSIPLAEAAQSWLPWNWLDKGYSVLPIQMFNWTSRPQQAFIELAATAGLVLLAITLLLNGWAIWLRYRLRKNIRW
ncbi:MAG: phosphate ABC transporter permease PstA [Alphaproteobacteria bacterium]|nr:phosphate ABC transporter permease PstA [Alphaproteobacteria bacterium]